MTPVVSSNLRAVGYDPDSATLVVEFHGGRVYTYAGVPDSVYHDLISATSPGSFFYARIRNRYPISEPCNFFYE